MVATSHSLLFEQYYPQLPDEADKPLGARCTIYIIDNRKPFKEEIHRALTYSNNAEPDMLLVLSASTEKIYNDRGYYKLST